MKLALLALSSIGYLLFLTSILKIKFSSAPFVYISVVVLTIYVFSIFGFLQAGAIVAISIGVILLAYMAAAQYKNIQISISDIKFSDFCKVFYLVPFFVLYHSIPSDFRFTEWDEFSFWALSAKLIFQTNSLYLRDSPVAFKTYPPVQQLFQYYFTYFTFWSEKNVLYAQVVFMLSSLMCISGSFFEKTTPLAMLAFLVACGSLYYFGYDFAHILVDPLLALVFAASIALAIESRGIKGALIVSAGAAVLVLTKQVGLILALVVAAAYFFNSLIENKEYKSYARLIKSCAYASILLVSVLLSFKSWSWYLEKIGATVSYPIPGISLIFAEPMLGRFGKTVIAFIDKIYKGEFGLVSIGIFKNSFSDLISKSSSVATFFDAISSNLVSTSVVGMTALLTLFSIISIAISMAGRRLGNALLFAVIAAGSIGYLAFLFLSYLFFFGEYEGVRLASFERYSGTYFLAWMLIVVSVYAASIDGLKHWQVKVVFAFPLFLCFLSLPNKFFKDAQNIDMSSDYLEKRHRVDALAELVKKRIVSGEKAYFINQNSTGFEKYIFSYSIIPASSALGCWSVGEKYHDGDVWTCNKKLAELLKGYKYLVIYNADERFWRDNAQLFTIESRGKESGVYEIAEDRGTISLNEVH